MTVLLVNFACQRGVDGILGLTLTFQIAVNFFVFQVMVVIFGIRAYIGKIFKGIEYFVLSSNPKHMECMIGISKLLTYKNLMYLQLLLPASTCNYLLSLIPEVITQS